MASWTTIPDSALQPGAPVRSLDGIALRDNAIAIAEGASGAPRIANIALRHTLVGDVPLIFNTPIKTSVGFPYTKVKEILLAREGALRVKFDLRVEAAGGTAFGRIYVNGIAVGVERSNTSATFITYTEDIIDLEVGDLIQLYTKNSVINFITSSADFNLYLDQAIETIVTL